MICSTPAARAWTGWSSRTRTTPRALLLATIEHAESRSLGALVRVALDGIDPTTRDALLLAVTRAHERLSPEGLARLLALPKRTVSQRLARAGFPAPATIALVGPLDRCRASARRPAPQRRPRRDSARFSVGERVSESLPALPERHAERDSSARRRGVRARDCAARGRRADQGSRAVRRPTDARNSGRREAVRRYVDRFAYASVRNSSRVR